MTMHYQNNPDEIKAICGLRTSPDSLVEDRNEVTCKRCLKAMPATGTVEPTVPAVLEVEPVMLPKPSETKKVKEMPDCLCGCGEKTKGGRFRPGHDARYHAALKGPKVMPDCKCGCGQKTKGGTFCPGHDAKYYSALGKLEKAAAKGQEVAA